VVAGTVVVVVVDVVVAMVVVGTVVVVLVVVVAVVAGALSTAPLFAHPERSTTASAANMSLGIQVAVARAHAFLEVLFAHFAPAGHRRGG
jgi:hypothetical protein